MGIKIAGVGSYTPEKILTNAELESMVDTTDEWITTRTGIKERRIADDETATSDLAYEASLKALEMAGLAPEDIDMISVASISADYVFPSTACVLQSKLKAKNAMCYDLQAACSGLLYSLEVSSNVLRGSKKYKNCLVVGAEKLSSIVDWEDRGTCVLFGDGAAAIVLEKTEDDEDCFVASSMGSNGDYANILSIPAGGSAMPTTVETIEQRLHYLKMEGQDVFKLAVTAMVRTCKEAMEEAGIGPEDIKWLIPHQANYRILKAVATRLKISEDNVYITVNKYGNTSAASIGLCVDEMVREDKVNKGDYVLLTAFGGGLTFGATLLKW